MPVDDANTIFTQNYSLANAEFRYNNNFRFVNFEIKAGVQNIFDVRYTAMLAVNAPPAGGNPPRYYYPGSPRNYFISIALGWNQL